MQITVKSPKNKSGEIELNFKDLVKLYNLKRFQKNASNSYNIKPNILKELDFSDWLVFSIYDKNGLRISGGKPLRKIKNVVENRELIGIDYNLESDLFNVIYENGLNKTGDRVVISMYNPKGSIPFFVYHFSEKFKLF